MLSEEPFLSKREHRFFNVAKAMAKTSTYHGTHVGCCVVYKGVVISVGCNSEKSHPMQMKYNKYRDFDPLTTTNKLHAEIRALSLLAEREDIDWSKVSVFVYRELKSGKPAISKPCSACSQYIKDLGISQVYYIDEYGSFVKEKHFK